MGKSFRGIEGEILLGGFESGDIEAQAGHSFFHLGAVFGGSYNQGAFSRFQALRDKSTYAFREELVGFIKLHEMLRTSCRWMRRFANARQILTAGIGWQIEVLHSFWVEITSSLFPAHLRLIITYNPLKK
jgi:hypothetical protein